MPETEGRGAAVPMQFHELGHLRAAAGHAVRVLPGPIGELVARELSAHAAFGYRFERDGLLARVARDILARPGGGS